SRDQGGTIHRRRRCEHCFQRFSTLESVVLPELMVVKRDGRREPFKREKIQTGLVHACQKRPIHVGELENIVEEIEGELYKLGQAEVESRVIGEMVMERLRKLDDIAYIRFASVYRSYPDIQAMRQEMDRILQGEQIANGQPTSEHLTAPPSDPARRHGKPESPSLPPHLCPHRLSPHSLRLPLRGRPSPPRGRERPFAPGHS